LKDEFKSKSDADLYNDLLFEIQVF
jgi:hypothetical protein